MGKSIRIKIADLTPELLEEQRRKARESRARWRATPEGKAKKAAENAKYRAARPDVVKEKSRAYCAKWRAKDKKHANELNKQSRARNPETGQRKQRRDNVRKYTLKRAKELILDISKRVPNYSCKEDIIAQSVLFVCEGARIYDAIKKATKVVLKEENFMQYAAVDIADCYWLEAEPEASEDASF